VRVRCHEGANLLSTLGEKGADEFPASFAEGNWLGLADEMKEAGINPGNRIEAGAGDFVQVAPLIGSAEKNGYGRVGFTSGLRGQAVGRLLLHHEDHALGEEAGEEVLHPGGGDGVGEVGNNFERSAGVTPGEWMVNGIPFEQVKGIGKAGEEGLPQVGSEKGIQLHSMDPGPFFKKRFREGPQARTDFDDGIVWLNPRQLKGFADNIAIDEEVLPERLPWTVTEGIEQIPGL
jgi:hypothetical protein